VTTWGHRPASRTVVESRHRDTCPGSNPRPPMTQPIEMEIVHQIRCKPPCQARNQESRLQRSAGQRAGLSKLTTGCDASNVLLYVGGSNSGGAVAIGTHEIPLVIDLVIQADHSKVFVGKVRHAAREKRCP